MVPVVLEGIQKLITKKTGLVFSESKIDILENTLKERMKQLKLSSLEGYYNLLLSAEPEGEAEWEQLYPLITIGESFFSVIKASFSCSNKEFFPKLYKEKKSKKKYPFGVPVVLREKNPTLSPS
ncbi:Chemotaxis protein methyltransferase CheR [Heliorestis convoluta]|uniref:Chemotaxis protein methyltransferase CheR n=1 Tax=Heliorestis convoluta TaxID=356322 RepID=A0A5Q2N6B9_9FIRM|nr:Chemotaxis protein methyltransferase CheR [Heliorestis convoluta]